MATWQAARWTNRRLERVDPGFGLLLDALAMVDVAVAQALGGRLPVCHKGCGSCCSQPIPVAPLELALLALYARQQRLPAAPATGTTCPLLGDDGSCLAYAVRPVACRQFVVFGVPCREGEDVVATRPAQVLRPNYRAMNAALAHTLPWYARWPEFPVQGDTAAGLAFVREHTVILQQAWRASVPGVRCDSR